MASKKISQLFTSTNPPLSAVTAVVYDNTTYKSTLSTLSGVLLSSASINWDNITNIPELATLVKVGPTPPTSGYTSGSLWFENVEGILYINYFDGDSSYWIPTNGGVPALSISSSYSDTSSNSHTSSYVESFDTVNIKSLDSTNINLYSEGGFVNITGSLNILGNQNISGSVIIGTGSLHNGIDEQPEILHVENSGSYNIAHFQSNNDYYAQINIKNTNNGPHASTDLVLTADNGNEVIHYVDLGINSSTYNQGVVGDYNDAYLLNAGKDLYIGTLGGQSFQSEVKLFTMNNWNNPHITLHAVDNIVTFNTSSIAEGYTYEFSGSLNLLHDINVNGITNLGSTSETIIPLNDPITEYTHDFNTGAILYVTGATGNTTIDLINVPTNNNKGIGLTIMIEQGSSPYIVDSIKINSDDEGPVSIIWLNGTPPGGNPNSYDIISFSILKINDTWKVFGQLTSF